MTAKLQVTLPKSLAAQYGIEPGSDIEWQAAGDVIRILPASAQRAGLDRSERLALFDAATDRQKQRQRSRRAPKARTRGQRDAGHARGWARGDLYTRGSTR